MKGRQAGEEDDVTITKDMIQAGIDAFENAMDASLSRETLVSRVFQAMYCERKSLCKAQNSEAAYPCIENKQKSA